MSILSVGQTCITTLAQSSPLLIVYWHTHSPLPTRTARDHHLRSPSSLMSLPSEVLGPWDWDYQRRRQSLGKPLARSGYCAQRDAQPRRIGTICCKEPSLVSWVQAYVEAWYWGTYEWSDGEVLRSQCSVGGCGWGEGGGTSQGEEIFEHVSVSLGPAGSGAVHAFTGVHISEGGYWVTVVDLDALLSRHESGTGVREPEKITEFLVSKDKSVAGPAFSSDGCAVILVSRDGRVVQLFHFQLGPVVGRAAGGASAVSKNRKSVVVSKREA